SGSTYDYIDARVEPGQWYWYWLVERVPGDAAPPDPGAIYGPAQVEIRLTVTLPYRIYLPMVASSWSDRR
ncbi:MAG: hypothetical protein JW934_23305, partial [Anaerolineae bacterium]|nr:hypothetical protein [Anaerolineae bacterium]